MVALSSYRPDFLFQLPTEPRSHWDPSVHVALDRSTTLPSQGVTLKSPSVQMIIRSVPKGNRPKVRFA
jgi:hypothetical protein